MGGWDVVIEYVVFIYLRVEESWINGKILYLI